MGKQIAEMLGDKEVLSGHALGGGREGRGLTWPSRASQRNREGGTCQLGRPLWMRRKSVRGGRSLRQDQGESGRRILGNTKIAGVSAGRWRRSSESSRGESGKCMEYQ